MQVKLIEAGTIREMEDNIKLWLEEMKAQATNDPGQITQDTPTLDRYTTTSKVTDFITIHHTYNMAEQRQSIPSIGSPQMKIEVRIGLFIFYTLK